MQILAELGARLDMSVSEIRKTIRRLRGCAKRYILVDPSKPEKQREILHVVGPWRLFLDRFNEGVLIPDIVRSPSSHGGVPGKSAVTNAMRHADSVYAYSLDLCDFYPSIHYTRVARVFRDELKYGDEVADVCTRLCTFEYHLATGLPTSPILADVVLRRLDVRINGLCLKSNLVYTRFVDDITISGKFDLMESGIVELVKLAIESEGFAVKSEKSRSGKLSKGFVITGLTVRRSKCRVNHDYIVMLEQELDFARKLGRGEEAQSTMYCSPGQLLGKIQYVTSLNISEKRRLMALFHSVDWGKYQESAMSQGLIQRRKRLRPI